MTLALFVLQLLLFACALPLLAKSLRTSRSRRSRHTGYLAVASILALSAIILALLLVGLSADEAYFDVATTLGPPLVTLSMCGWIIWRALGSANGTQVQSKRRRAHGQGS